MMITIKHVPKKKKKKNLDERNQLLSLQNLEKNWYQVWVGEKNDGLKRETDETKPSFKNPKR